MNRIQFLAFAGAVREMPQVEVKDDRGRPHRFVKLDQVLQALGERVLLEERERKLGLVLPDGTPAGTAAPGRSEEIPAERMGVIGDRVMDAIIKGSLVGSSEEGAMVWSANAAEQIGAAALGAVRVTEGKTAKTE